MEQMVNAKTHHLNVLLDPKSIAIIGASNDPNKINGRPIENLKRYGYDGNVFPVNPKYQEILGYRCYPSILEIPYEIDMAIIALPAKLVLETLRDCASKNVKSAVIFSSGFAELGDEGRKIQDKISELSSELGISIIGPNCQGVANLKSKSIASFTTAFAVGDLHYGSAAMLSQSGAVAAMVYNILKNFKEGIKYWVSTGNESDVNVPKLIECVLEDPDVKVVLSYFEDVKDGETLINASRKANKYNKPILALKSGKTMEGQKAASSHTGALATEDAVFDAALENLGIVRVDDVIELATFPQIFSSPVRLKGNRVAILTNSGGLGVMIVDKCKELGLGISVFSSETKQKLIGVLPEFASSDNPIDVTAQLLNDKEMLSNTLPILMADPNIDVILLALGILGKGYDIPKMVEDILKLQQSVNKLIVVATVGCESQEITDQFAKSGIPTFTDPSLATKAISKFAQYSLASARQITQQESAKSPLAEKLLSAYHSKSNNGFLSEYYSKEILKSHKGFVFPNEVLVQSEQEAVNAAAIIGFPVAIKVSSPFVLHKTDMGALKLNIQNETELRESYRTILANVRNNGVDKIEGTLVQEMVEKGFEISLGLKRDPVFGSMIMVASGGIYLEVMKDFKLLLAPVSYQDAENAVNSLVMAPLLYGVRGSAKLDIKALCETIVAFSRFVQSLEDDLIEMDLNPISVLQAGKGVKILDALIRLKS